MFLYFFLNHSILAHQKLSTPQDLGVVSSNRIVIRLYKKGIDVPKYGKTC